MANMVPLSSSNLSAAGWSAEEGLIVEFNNGSRYIYPEAPQSVFGALTTAPSPGSYFARFVKGRYSFEREE